MRRQSSPMYGPEFRARRGQRIQLDAVPVEEWSWRPADPAGAALVTSPPLVEDAILTNYRPSRRRQQVVLLFEHGVLGAPLIEAMRAARLKYFYADFAELAEGGHVSLTPEGGELRFGPAVLRLEDVAAVVWSQPWPIVTADHRKEARGPELFRHRWGQVLRELKGLLSPDVLWLPSHPFAGANQWQEKLSELALARRLGLEVPPTLATNDPSRARAFVAEHGKVVFKEFGHAPNRFRVGFVDPEDPRFAHLEHAPVTLQAYVEKEYEVRAVAVGERIFACRIDSQASPRAKTDWRVYDNANVAWSRMELPRGIAAKLVRLLAKLELRWGSIDLIKARDGGFVFLEVNRPGATYWLKPFVGLDVPAELARLIRAHLGR